MEATHAPKPLHPHTTVVPVLVYPDGPEATPWLCQAFGLTVSLGVDTRRVQLNVVHGAVAVRESAQ